jgi:transcriptional regulator with XRE-family HTH domain
MSFLKLHSVVEGRAVPHPLAMPQKTKPEPQRRRTFIKEWRAFRGMTQEDLAELIDMTPSNLSQLERGRINYTQETLEAAAKALGCSVVDLLSRAPTDSESMFALWEQATPNKRSTFIEIAKTILKAPEG